MHELRQRFFCAILHGGVRGQNYFLSKIFSLLRIAKKQKLNKLVANSTIFNKKKK